MNMWHVARQSAIGLAVASALILAGTTSALANEQAPEIETVEVAAGEAIVVTVEVGASQPGDAGTIVDVHEEVPVTAALVCGWNVSDTTSTGYTYTYYNCSSVAISLKPDYIFVDGSCRTATPYGTAWWYISINALNPFTGNMIPC